MRRDEPDHRRRRAAQRLWPGHRTEHGDPGYRTEEEYATALTCAAADAEASVDHLANLCNTGMLPTDRVILDMLVSK